MNRGAFDIDKRGGQLGLSLVNPKGESFFLYDQPLLSMWENRDRYTRVKLRNRDEKQAIGYHAGEILGALDLRENLVRIHLFFGPTGQDIEQDESTKKLKNVVNRQLYELPEKELEACVKAFDAVRSNHARFQELMHHGTVLALFPR